MEQKRVVLVASDQAAKVLQPADRAFDDPALSVATQGATILCGRADSPAAMWTDELDVACAKPFSHGITVGSAIVHESIGNVARDGAIEQRLDQIHFGHTRTFDIYAERKPAAIDQEHELGALAALRRTNEIAPFFAEANVPSAEPCRQSIPPCWSSLWTSRRQAFSQTPEADQVMKRRQQVTYEGNVRGRSFQRAPLRSTHKMPSRQRRGSCLGRPPRGSGAGSDSKSEISRHCSSDNTPASATTHATAINAKRSFGRLDLRTPPASSDTSRTNRAFSYRRQDS